MSRKRPDDATETPKRTRRARKPTGPSPKELASLEPGAFRRAMLEQALSDLVAAREKGSMSAVMTLTGHVVRLRAEIAQAEERDRTALMSARTTDELVEDLVRLIAKLPDGVFERVVAAVEQRRTGRARMRLA